MSKFERWTIILGVLMLVLTVLGLIVGAVYYLRPNPAPKKPGELVAQPPLNLPGNAPDEPKKYVPLRDGSPTTVPITNVGEHNVLVKQVDFVIAEKKDTPARPNFYAGAVALPVNFKKHNFVGNGRFVLVLNPAAETPPDTSAQLELAIVEPSWVGITYVGSVTVTYSEGDKNIERTIPNVELDVLETTPIPPR